MAKKLDKPSADRLRQEFAEDLKPSMPHPSKTRHPDDRLDEFGREMNSGIPMAPPVGYKRQPSLVELVRDMVRSEKVRAYAEDQGMESFEEADDFDVPDDEDPISNGTPYENEFDPPVRELVKAGKEAAKERQVREAAAKALSDPPAAPVPPGSPPGAPMPAKGT